MLEISKFPLRGQIALVVIILNGACILSSRAAAFPDWTDCPVVCSCKWSSGKKSAFCPDAGLTSLPASLDPEMQILDLSGNSIPDLQSEIFKLAGLVNLQKVYLRNAGIHTINSDAFKDMRILVEIDLSDNDVTTLEPNTFLGNERLKELTLSGNPLVTLRSHQFPMLKHLRNLELQRCSLTVIHSHAFVSLPGLESLKLDGNQLTYLEVTTISSLPSLKTLTLDSNQWSCDCKLKHFRAWLIPDVPKKIYSVSQTCKSPPRLEGRRWEDAKPSDFACEPQVKIYASSIQEDMNGNFSLSCHITGDPMPEFSWQLNGSPLNPSRPEFVYPTALHITNVTSGTNLDDDITSNYKIPERWSNITIYNITDSDAGQYACNAQNIAGTTSDRVNIVVSRVFTAPTLSQSDNWFFWIMFVSAGTIFILITILFLLFCFCGESRSYNRHEKVKLQSSISFEDQGKKLLDLSVTTNVGLEGNANERISGHGSLTETCSSGEFELAERPSICDATTVTVERLRPDYSMTSNSKSILHTAATDFPPPPPEFTGGILPSGMFENIFISMALSQDMERCYPDLLDIPVHASSVVEKYNASNLLPATSMIASFATLPRRTLRLSDSGSQYDNMGPRITATGSSTFSLTDDYRLSSSSLTSVIKPPIEFVSL